MKCNQFDFHISEQWEPGLRRHPGPEHLALCCVFNFNVPTRNQTIATVSESFAKHGWTLESDKRVKTTGLTEKITLSQKQIILWDIRINMCKYICTITANCMIFYQ